MANHISHAGLPFPIYGKKYTVMIPYLDADGDPVDPTSPDTEISIDGGTFTDATNEVTVISGGNGGSYLTLTGFEMQASALMIAAKSANAKTTLLTLNPYRTAQIGGAVNQIVSLTSQSEFIVNTADVASAFGTKDIRIEGLFLSIQGASPPADTEVRPIVIYDGTTGTIEVRPPYEAAVTVGAFYSFLFPLGTGTILEQVIRSGGFAR